jgi:hypothetical protein
MTSEGTAEMGKIFPKIKIVSPQFWESHGRSDKKHPSIGSLKFCAYLQIAQSNKSENGKFISEIYFTSKAKSWALQTFHQFFTPVSAALVKFLVHEHVISFNLLQEFVGLHEIRCGAVVWSRFHFGTVFTIQCLNWIIVDLRQIRESNLRYEAIWSDCQKMRKELTWKHLYMSINYHFLKGNTRVRELVRNREKIQLYLGLSRFVQPSLSGITHIFIWFIQKFG